jgi:hypothetical protein
MIIKERLEEALNQVRNQITQDVKDPSVSGVDFFDSACGSAVNLYQALQ